MRAFIQLGDIQARLKLSSLFYLDDAVREIAEGGADTTGIRSILTQVAAEPVAGTVLSLREKDSVLLACSTGCVPCIKKYVYRDARATADQST